MAILTQSYRIFATHCFEIGGGEGRTKVRSSQQWFKVLLHHPGLDPLLSLGVREGQFVTAAGVDTGQP